MVELERTTKQEDKDHCEKVLDPRAEAVALGACDGPKIPMAEEFFLSRN